MPSHSSRLPPRWSSTAARSGRRASCSGAWPTSPGGAGRRKLRSPESPRPRRASGGLPRRRSKRRNPLRTTPTKSSWGSGPSCARCCVRASWPDGRNPMPRYIGKEMSRVDGVAKVTGKAKYAAEFQVPNLAYGFIVPSTVTKGTITAIDTREAEATPGVIRVFTHLNTPKLGPGSSEEAPPRGNQEEEDKSFRALQSEKIYFNRQPIALVVAETYEQARYASRLVKVSYNTEKHVTDTEAVRERARVPSQGPPPKPRGNPEEAMKSAPVKIEAEYRIPIEHHNPMEPHGAIAVWQGDKLTIFDKTQEVYNVREHLASRLGVPEENITVVSPFVGGAFGSSLRPNYYPSLTAMAARELRRPVKVVYTRTHMYSGHGYRPYTIQKVALGAERSGKLSAMIHEFVHNTSSFEDFSDGTTNFTRQVYACPNLYAPVKITGTDLNTPTWMRAPGAVSGMFAQDRSAGAAPHQLRRGGPREWQAVFEQGAAGVLQARSGEVRMEGPQV